MSDKLGEEQLGTNQFGGESVEEDDFVPISDDLNDSVQPPGPETSIERMFSHIKPAFQPRDNDNWRALVETFAEEFQELSDARQETMIAQYVETALGGQLDRIGEFVKTPRKSGETDDEYRPRLIVEFKKITAGGTIDELIEVSAILLGTSESKIEVEEPYDVEYARVDLKVNQDLIDKAEITTSDYAGYLREIKAAGVKLKGIAQGGFTHRSEEDFNNGVNDTSKSYNEAPYTGLF